LPRSTALDVFEPLSLAERLFVRGRLSSAPLQALAERAPSGTIADIGCGHGLLTALLAVDRSDRHIVGVDPDQRKIELARRAVGKLPNVELRHCAIEALSPERDGTFDAVVVADVLYLLPVEVWPRFLASARKLLRPTGKLLLKEARDDGSWKYWKCIAQEQLMVRVLRRTLTSGGLNFLTSERMERLLIDVGFRVTEVVDLSEGYATPHVLYVAAPSWR
jgi:2-polyprenyl-6-hydroxyphenyl methylase/3-demethylubiquinone-9 3-methyltransferase